MKEFINEQFYFLRPTKSTLLLKYNTEHGQLLSLSLFCACSTRNLAISTYQHSIYVHTIPIPTLAAIPKTPQHLLNTSSTQSDAHHSNKVPSEGWEGAPGLGIVPVPAASSSVGLPVEDS